MFVHLIHIPAWVDIYLCHIDIENPHNASFFFVSADPELIRDYTLEVMNDVYKKNVLCLTKSSLKVIRPAATPEALQAEGAKTKNTCSVVSVSCPC